MTPLLARAKMSLRDMVGNALATTRGVYGAGELLTA
jgi:hypothetical protein